MSGRDVHRNATTLFSVAMIVIGVALVARTLSAGGGPLSIGVIMGVLFLAAGLGRIWVARSTRR
ncbi:MAG TPA: hypothetical protein VMT10_07370 [Solirubrobacteraceae bacterium]|nr:hypothetical protein [Solirubrobacteraceae bacterium]